ncbi:MAG: nucleotidyltransferase domain-containing protein [bacterium]
MSLITAAQIEAAKERLVKAYDPIKIYIFGSYAWGKPHEDSDLDLMIIIPSSNTPKPHLRTYTGHKALFGLDIAKELIVLTEQEFKDRSSNENFLAYKVKNEGLCIYSRSYCRS